MNPIQAVAESREQELLRQARQARRAAGLRNRPRFAARLIQSILSSNDSRPPAVELPRVTTVEIDA